MKLIKLIILTIALSANSVYSQEQNSATRDINSNYTTELSRDSLILIPPTNLQAFLQYDYIHLTWNAPQDNNFSLPDGLMGYNLYRDSVLISFIAVPDTLYYDMNLLPDEYIYHVSALYDLTYYGYPGETGESSYEGPVIIDTYYLFGLPFDEYFNTGYFETNMWVPDTLNWHIAGQSGNSAPCAEFSSAPLQSNYAISLTSGWLDGRFTDGLISLDFDLKLDDISSNGQEVLITEVYNGTNWKVVASDTAQGDFDWENRHIDITIPAKGHVFYIRFTAKGINSTNINYWQVDNIHVYKTCAGATELEAQLPWPNYPCKIELNWIAPENMTRELRDYSIFRYEDNGAHTYIGSTSNTTYIDDISGLLDEEDTLSYVVLTRYIDCYSDYSNQAQVLGSVCPVSVENVELEPVKIFPNPAGTIATINMNEEIDKFTLYDRLGNEIYTYQVINSGKQSYPLNVTEYSNGIYYLSFVTKKGKSLGKKLIILH